MKLIADYLWGIITVWHEAQGESYRGKRAVAEVIQRRTKRKFMSDGTIASTCLWPLQFSGWNSRDATPNYKERIEGAKLDSSNPVVDECVRAWYDAERGPEIVPGCMHYYNQAIANPDWAKGAEIVAEIGRHKFVIPGKG